MKLWVGCLLCLTMRAGVPVVVDTDAGSDDVLALLWLTRQPDVQIEAVTVANGLAHPVAGADTVLRVLEAAGLTRVPVYVGSAKPTEGEGAFPGEWRLAADRLLRDEFPAARRKPETMSAAQYLAGRLLDARRPVRLLALGPLTNLAEALEIEPRTGHAITELVWMGGALRVPGNVPAAPSAEWNVWVDPEAAEVVLGRTGWRRRVVALDATDRIPIGPDVLRTFENEAREWLATLVLRILRAEAAGIRSGTYHAWDLVAAMAFVDPALVTTDPTAIAIRKRPRERGRFVELDGVRPNAEVAIAADAARFRKKLLSVLP